MVVATWVALKNVDFLGSGAVVEKKKSDANDELPWTNGQQKQ